MGFLEFRVQIQVFGLKLRMKFGMGCWGAASSLGFRLESGMGLAFKHGLSGISLAASIVGPRLKAHRGTYGAASGRKQTTAELNWILQRSKRDVRERKRERERERERERDRGRERERKGKKESERERARQSESESKRASACGCLFVSLFDSVIFHDLDSYRR